MSTRGRVCLHVPYLYPLLAHGAGGTAGGAEVQQRQFALGLAQRGFEVSVVTCDYGQPSPERRDELAIWKSFAPHAGWPVLRFVHPRLTSTVAALWRANAEVYFMKGSGLLPGVTCDVAHARGAAFAWLAAHDYDVEPDFPALEHGRERAWFRRALLGCDLRLVQTEFQRTRLASVWGLESGVVKSPIGRIETATDPGSASVVLWVATYRERKRPEWFTELAARFPKHRFKMCGHVPEPPLTRDPFDAARARARELPNLEVLGDVPHQQVGTLYREAAVVVHTSEAEGFPNVFLEAWAHGVPTLSAVDPDHIVATHGIGRVAQTLDGFASELSRLLDDPEQRRVLGTRARAYVSEHHDRERILDQLAERFDELIARRRARGRAGDTEPRARARDR
ncbi:MAG: glycosyltransferase family 4 protein [Candidatus Eisenbacteria bacterium]|uniref:Glycosyltransferase family 4 protein n=1 Tax=Eiseniibacteriota bacterium TaxID=2212470 RepID=A0A849SID1_UNCEI|nr:glycosyltransferase family 4 protein [Candidatus Eisenbacteria bacterium]